LINIAIAGVGGQGNVLVSEIMAEAALIEGLNVIVGEIFGISQRGGSVISHVRVGDVADLSGPLPSERAVDIVCGLEPMEALRVGQALIKDTGLVITNVRPFYPVDVNRGKSVYPSIERIVSALRKLCSQVISFDATALAEQAGNAVAANLVLLGALSTVTKLSVSLESYEKAIRRTVRGGLEMNMTAFHLGRQKFIANAA
jgi:indolepyruvate ferredoxin oxidoreductase beta subunit